MLQTVAAGFRDDQENKPRVGRVEESRQARKRGQGARRRRDGRGLGIETGERASMRHHPLPLHELKSHTVFGRSTCGMGGTSTHVIDDRSM